MFHLWTKLFDKICQCSDFKKMNSRNFKTKNDTRVNIKIFIKIHLPAVLWYLISTLCLSQTIFSPPKLCLPNTPPYFPIIFPTTSLPHPGQMEALSLHLSKARPVHELWILSSSSICHCSPIAFSLSSIPSSSSLLVLPSSPETHPLMPCSTGATVLFHSSLSHSLATSFQWSTHGLRNLIASLFCCISQQPLALAAYSFLEMIQPHLAWSHTLLVSSYFSKLLISLFC